MGFYDFKPCSTSVRDRRGAEGGPDGLSGGVPNCLGMQLRAATGKAPSIGVMWVVWIGLRIQPVRTGAAEPGAPCSPALRPRTPGEPDPAPLVVEG